MAEKKTQQTEAPVETNEIAVKNNAAPAVGVMAGLEAFAAFRKEGPMVGFDDVTADDIKMPKIKLAQPTSAEVTDEKCKAGQFFNVTTGEAVDILECQLLSLGKSRVRWPEVFKRGDEPLCRSFDSKVSDTTGEFCDHCPHKEWKDGQRPSCGQSYVWMGLLPNGQPFRMTTAGAQIAEAKNFITSVVGAGYPPFIYHMALTSEKQKNEKGTYYITKFNFAKNEDGSFKLINPTESEMVRYETKIKGLQEIFNKVRAVDLVSGDADIAVGEDDDEDGVF